MTYTETQLEAIRLFGDKTLSEGCLLNISFIDLVHREIGGYDNEVKEQREIVGKYISPSTKDKDFYFSWDFSVFNFKDFGENPFVNNYEILGHIPHLFPDVAIGAKEKGFKIKTYYTNQGDYIVNVYGIIGKNLEDYEIMYNPTLPLLDQPNLSDIISLFR